MTDAIAPLSTVPATEHAQRRQSAERVSCPTCDKTVVGGAIVTRWPGYYSTAHGCWQVQRVMYCDHCEQLIHWTEQVRHVSTARRDDEVVAVDGLLTGLVLMGPGVERTRARIATYLRRYPQLKGVEQS